MRAVLGLLDVIFILILWLLLLLLVITLLSLTLKLLSWWSSSFLLGCISACTWVNTDGVSLLSTLLLMLLGKVSNLGLLYNSSSWPCAAAAVIATAACNGLACTSSILPKCLSFRSNEAWDNKSFTVNLRCPKWLLLSCDNGYVYVSYLTCGVEAAECLFDWGRNEERREKCDGVNQLL